MSMSIKASCSLSCFPSSLSNTILNCQKIYKTSLGRQPFGNKYTVQHIASLKVEQRYFRHENVISKKGHIRKCFPVASEGFFPDNVIEVDTADPEELPLDFAQHVDDEDIISGDSYKNSEENGGKSGFVSFYYRHQRKDNVARTSTIKKNHNSLLWFAGPAILVGSFILPSLYLRRIISTIFEDSLLTDFLILFFTEALFYCGVAVFLLIIHHLWSPGKIATATSDLGKHTNQIGHRISYVAVLMLSLIIPMVTMGFVWPWTGPAASATLAPYLVGIVVQYAFEQYARYTKSPSWSVIPVVFQVYRLHQLNRAAQLVTALSFTVRGAEMTAHNLAINKSLGTLLNVLQILGLICIWSLSNFLMRFFPSSAIEQ
ncbi:uncharacterized protein LOC141608871 isoform X2 [Silene latifolia]|uniref:uncharacterized protein LOC141608871 isoform X2 n=1 Tax=Silene latifolia TaxID=37657 RepID=UPI003D76EFDB